MRKKIRGEERDTTTHLIETVLTHPSHVTKFSTCISKTEIGERQSCDLYSLGMKLFPHLLDSKATWRLLESF